MLEAVRTTGPSEQPTKSGKMEEHTNMPNVNKTGEQPKRRAVTAESMAAKPRDISVSEFFAKNRHLLGFDNPRKALLTAVKEAVDNSLDACEEAGIVPEVWVHIETTGVNRYKIGVQEQTVAHHGLPIL
jgi:DNA topoisomerase VI subunit B